MPTKKALAVLNQDPVLRSITGLKLTAYRKHPDVFQDLVRSIVSQQLSGKAASTIHGRFLKLFSKQEVTPQKVLNRTVEELRGVGLSRMKASYIHNIARAAIDQKFSKYDWNSASDDEVLKKLTAIKGVGNWTAHMIMMFTLRRNNIFPVGDLSIQQAMVELYGLTVEGKALRIKMEEISQTWAPYRSHAARYLWAWKDQ